MGNIATATPVLNPAILRKVDNFLEDFYSESKRAGNDLAAVKMKNAQVRGLETLVASTTRFSEILNYIKNQAGKEKDKEKKWSETAPLLLEQLNTLEERAKEISKGQPQSLLNVKLRLARGWARQVVAQYVYAVFEADREIKDDDR
ncbi:MAG: hypothetical protein ABSG91_20740 [Syntrophobacteraceae bacterium]|jgi:hypothetical protein